MKYLQIPKWSGDVEIEVHEGDDVDHDGEGDDWDPDNIQQHKSSWYTSGTMNKLLQSPFYIPILTVMKIWNQEKFHYKVHVACFQVVILSFKIHIRYIKLKSNLTTWGLVLLWNTNKTLLTFRLISTTSDNYNYDSGEAQMTISIALAV